MAKRTAKRSKTILLSNKARRNILLTSLAFFTSLLFATMHYRHQYNSEQDWHIYHDKVMKVINVADGDTIYVDIHDNIARRGSTRIRLLGVDTPELGKDDQPDKPFAREATEFVISQIMDKDVCIKLEPNRSSHRDKYDRLLAYIYLADKETMLNELLITDGYGWPEHRHEHLYQDRFDKLYKIAKDSKKGLWALPDPQLPTYFE